MGSIKMILDKNMNHISMKQLYILAMGWAVEKEGQNLSHQGIMHRVDVDIVADYLDYVWKNKEGEGSKIQANQQEL